MQINSHTQINGTALDALTYCERHANGFGLEAMRTLDPAHRERCLIQARDFAALAELIHAARRFEGGR